MRWEGIKAIKGKVRAANQGREIYVVSRIKLGFVKLRYLEVRR